MILCSLEGCIQSIYRESGSGGEEHITSVSTYTLKMEVCPSSGNYPKTTLPTVVIEIMVSFHIKLKNRLND
jgi:hypothetical protein